MGLKLGDALGVGLDRWGGVGRVDHFNDGMFRPFGIDDDDLPGGRRDLRPLLIELPSQASVVGNHFRNR